MPAIKRFVFGFGAPEKAKPPLGKHHDGWLPPVGPRAPTYDVWFCFRRAFGSLLRFCTGPGSFLRS